MAAAMSLLIRRGASRELGLLYLQTTRRKWAKVAFTYANGTRKWGVVPLAFYTSAAEVNGGGTALADLMP
eukprot:5868488-Amphidinium_carterae.1